MPTGSQSASRPAWLEPPGSQSGLKQYVQVLRERTWIVVATVVLTVAAAAGYLLLADKVYEAEADLLVSPAASDDPLLNLLPVFRGTGDPTRDVETAAQLAVNLDVAERVAEDLDTNRNARSLLGDVTAEPVASSNIVAVIAQGDSPTEAAELANAFGDAAVDDRTETLHTAIDQVLSGDTNVLSSSDVSRLETLRNRPDDTIRVETEAIPPASATWPRPALTLAAALLAGLVLGVAAAFIAQALDPRLQREDQLRNRYRLPVLARVPRESVRSRGRPLAPGVISPATQESYRTLRANITASGGAPGRAQSVLVTGSAPSEGKTTTAINLAATFALTDRRVILIEADLRRPAIARTLGLQVRSGVVSTLLGESSLEESLMTAEPYGPHLRLLLADYEGGAMSELFSLRAAERLLNEAQQLADLVVIDSPPLTAVVDALPLARRVDDVLIVTRLGVTRLDRLQELSELLAANDIVPLGFALLGGGKSKSGYYQKSTSVTIRTHQDGAADELAPSPAVYER